LQRLPLSYQPIIGRFLTIEGFAYGAILKPPLAPGIITDPSAQQVYIGVIIQRNAGT